MFQEKTIKKVLWLPDQTTARAIAKAFWSTGSSTGQSAFEMLATEHSQRVHSTVWSTVAAQSTTCLLAEGHLPCISNFHFLNHPNFMELINIMLQETQRPQS